MNTDNVKYKQFKVKRQKNSETRVKFSRQEQEETKYRPTMRTLKRSYKPLACVWLTDRPRQVESGDQQNVYEGCKRVKMVVDTAIPVSYTHLDVYKRQQ